LATVEHPSLRLQVFYRLINVCIFSRNIKALLAPIHVATSQCLPLFPRRLFQLAQTSGEGYCFDRLEWAQMLSSDHGEPIDFERLPFGKILLFRIRMSIALAQPKTLDAMPEHAVIPHKCGSCKSGILAKRKIPRHNGQKHSDLRSRFHHTLFAHRRYHSSLEKMLAVNSPIITQTQAHLVTSARISEIVYPFQSWINLGIFSSISRKGWFLL